MHESTHRLWQKTLAPCHPVWVELSCDCEIEKKMRHNKEGVKEKINERKNEWKKEKKMSANEWMDRRAEKEEWFDCLFQRHVGLLYFCCFQMHMFSFFLHFSMFSLFASSCLSVFHASCFFSLSACMYRSRFSEIFVNDIEDSEDLSTIVNQYLKGCATDLPVDSIVRFYLEARQLSQTTLLDGLSK